MMMEATSSELKGSGIVRPPYLPVRLQTQKSELLVAAISVGVTVFVSLTEVALVHFAIPQARTVVPGSFLVSTATLITPVVAVGTIGATLFGSFVEARVQSSLTQLKRAAEVAIAISAVTTAIRVASIFTISSLITRACIPA